ncbi:hypothetical protein BYT27DRAFT_6697697 [Phlegmacium glaucopus]|nr:hypothetical protein BYT27DRAFT_6697697 [Phlegmacium glaucopus]
MSSSGQQHATRQGLSPVDTDTEAIFAGNLLSDAEHEAQDSALKQKLRHHYWDVGSNDTRSRVFCEVVESAIKLRPDIYKTVTDDELDALLLVERIQNIIDEDTKNRQFRNIRNLGTRRQFQKFL